MITNLVSCRSKFATPRRKPLSNPVWTGAPAWCYCTGFPEDTSYQPLRVSWYVPAPKTIQLRLCRGWTRKRRDGAPHPTTCLPRHREAICKVDISMCQCSLLSYRGIQHPVMAYSSRWLSVNGNSIVISGMLPIFPWQKLPLSALSGISYHRYVHPVPITFFCFSARAINHKSTFLQLVQIRPSVGSQY